MVARSLRRIALVFCAVLAACSGTAHETFVTPVTSSGPTACEDADVRLAEAATLQADGYLGRALPLVETALELCPSQATRLAHAVALADLWLDQDAIEAYKAYAAVGDADARSAAGDAIAELTQRSPTGTTAGHTGPRRAPFSTVGRPGPTTYAPPGSTTASSRCWS